MLARPARRLLMANDSAPQTNAKTAASAAIIEAMRRKVDREQLREARLGGRASSAEAIRKAAEQRARENRDRDLGGSKRWAGRAH
jgi:hypothetical protein